jgi:hypothetical protein
MSRDTTRILQELESGHTPWVKPWSNFPGNSVPCNAVTNRPYSGCNIILIKLRLGIPHVFLPEAMSGKGNTEPKSFS